MKIVKEKRFTVCVDLNQGRGEHIVYTTDFTTDYVKLNMDMVSYAGSPTKVNLTTAGFGTRSNSDMLFVTSTKPSLRA